MNRNIDRLKLIFLGIFAFACAATWVYQIGWKWPQQRCEANGQWWDADTRICARPIYIPSLTGRPEGVSRKEWSEKQAAEQVAKERF